MWALTSMVTAQRAAWLSAPAGAVTVGVQGGALPPVLVTPRVPLLLPFCEPFHIAVQHFPIRDTYDREPVLYRNSLKMGKGDTWHMVYSRNLPI